MRPAGWIKKRLAAPLAGALPGGLWRRALSSTDTDRVLATIVALHRVSPRVEDELSVTPRQLKALCEYWRREYRVVSLGQLLQMLSTGPGAGISERPRLVITFDDGYADNAEVAAPILKAAGLTATFFLASGFVGTQRRFAWDVPLSFVPAIMSWAQARELVQAGFSVGSHTRNHVRVSQCSTGELSAELVYSRMEIEDRVGQPVLDFAYPFGAASDCLAEQRATIAAAGYRSCLSCHGGAVFAGDDAYWLERIAISPRYHATPGAWERQRLLTIRRSVDAREGVQPRTAASPSAPDKAKVH